MSENDATIKIIELSGESIQDRLEVVFAEHEELVRMLHEMLLSDNYTIPLGPDTDVRHPNYIEEHRPEITRLLSDLAPNAMADTEIQTYLYHSLILLIMDIQQNTLSFENALSIIVDQVDWVGGVVTMGYPVQIALDADTDGFEDGTYQGRVEGNPTAGFTLNVYPTRWEGFSPVQIHKQLQ